MSKFTPIHQHLLIKAYSSNPITSEMQAKMFLQSLVGYIGMKPVTMPQAFYVKDLGNEGLTGSINLATSHIAFHCWDDSGLFMMDVYSCKPFDTVDTLNYITRHWNLITNDRSKPLLYTVIDRNSFDFYDEMIYT